MTDERAEHERMAKSYADDLNDLVRRAGEGDDDAHDELWGYGLDFYVQGERRGGEWTVTGWVLLLCTGGPHFELRSDGYVHGWGWFKSNEVSHPVDDAVTELFAEWAEQ